MRVHDIQLGSNLDILPAACNFETFCGERVESTGTRKSMVKWDKDRDLDSNRGKNILGTAEQGQRGRNRRNVTQTGINREIGTLTVTGIEGHQ